MKVIKFGGSSLASAEQLKKVLDIVRNVLEDDSVDINTSQTNNAKWDSMAQLNIMVELESEFGLSLEPEEISSIKSVKDIIEIVNRKSI